MTPVVVFAFHAIPILIANMIFTDFRYICRIAPFTSGTDTATGSLDSFKDTMIDLWLAAEDAFIYKNGFGHRCFCFGGLHGLQMQRQLRNVSPWLHAHPVLEKGQRPFHQPRLPFIRFITHLAK